MESIWITILNFFMSLSLLIILHELGHFIPARLFGARVEKFMLFFDINFTLFKKKIGETVYGIGWLPLGGYVKISGMIDESMDKEQMKEEPKPWEFRSKPAWQRLIIMLGGVTVNVIVGFLIYGLLIFSMGKPEFYGEDAKYGFGFPKELEEVGFEQGDKVLLVDNDTLIDATMLIRHLMLRSPETVTVIRDGSQVDIDIPENIDKTLFSAGVSPSLKPLWPFTITEIKEGMVADSLGMKVGATITEVAGQKIVYNNDLTYALSNFVDAGKPFDITFQQDGETLSKTAILDPDEDQLLGIVMTSSEDDAMTITTREYGFGKSLVLGVEKGYWTIHDYIAQLGFIFTEKGAKSLGGFVTIGKLYEDSFDWPSFWNTTALISFILAVMNLLPIPALDGGHVMFLIYEMVTGRKPNDKFMEVAQTVGIIILLALMLYANGNDVYKLIFK